MYCLDGSSILDKLVKEYLDIPRHDEVNVGVVVFTVVDD